MDFESGMKRDRVELSALVRTRDGRVHARGEKAEVVRRSEQFGRAMLLVRFDDNSVGFVYLDEVSS